MMKNFKEDPRFVGIKPFEKKLWLSSPTMHGDEQHWVDDAILTNWVSTVGANINEVEKQVAARIGVNYAVALSCGTAALHLATKLAGEKLYGQAKPNGGTGGIKSYFWTPEFEMSRLHTRYSNWNRDAAAFGRLQFVE